MDSSLILVYKNNQLLYQLKAVFIGKNFCTLTSETELPPELYDYFQIYNCSTNYVEHYIKTGLLTTIMDNVDDVTIENPYPKGFSIDDVIKEIVGRDFDSQLHNDIKYDYEFDFETNTLKFKPCRPIEHITINITVNGDKINEFIL